MPPFDCPDFDTSCVSTTAQYVDISLPVKIKPNACVGEVRTECVTEPRVSLYPSCGSRCACEIVITQTLLIRIPIEYSATAETGTPCAQCYPPDECH